MGELTLDVSTGFIPEEELVELAEPPDGLVAGGWTIVISVASALSAAWESCPTNICTQRCNS